MTWREVHQSFTLRAPSPPPSSEPVKVETAPVQPPPDLLNMDDHVPAAAELEEKNALVLAIVPADQQPSTVQIMQMEPLVRNWLLLQLLAQMRVLQQLANWLEVWTCLH